MKKIYILSAVLMLFLSACESFLDEQPQSEISTDKYWKTEDDINTGLAGIYDGLQRTFSSNWIYWGDARTDNFGPYQYGNSQYGLNGLTPGISGSDWSPLYTTIGRANTAIKYISAIDGLDPAVLDHSLAQCYAIRAYAYFWVVRLWGDAPVWTEPYEDLKEEPARDRVAVNTIIDDVIIPDLEKAYSLVNGDRDLVWEVNIGGICAMLMDVYMWKKDYQKAVEWSNKLFGLDRYELVPSTDWKTLFTDPSATDENIWSLHWDWTVDGGIGIGAQIGAGNTNSDFQLVDTLWNYWTSDSTDLRGWQSIDVEAQNQDKFLKFYTKVIDSENGRQLYPNSSQVDAYLPLYRLADIYLMRAEALNKLNDPIGSLDYLNRVHTRAGLQPFSQSDFSGTDQLENVILHERQLELFMEGRRWFDLVRTGKVIEIMDPILKQRQQEEGSPQTGFGDPGKILWPIDPNVLNANPKLKQNPAY